MPSLIHLEYARADAAERRRLGRARPPLPPRPEPPPLRRRAAAGLARLARRLDAETARRVAA